MKNLSNGIFFMLASSFLGALNSALAKILSSYVPALEIVFFRNLIGVFIILAMLKHKPPLKFDKSKLHLLISRGFFGFLAMFLFFYTISVIPLGDAITLNKTSPIFVAILAFFILKERLSLFRILGVLVGFIGVILVAKPKGFELDFAYFLGILGGLFAALAYTTINKIKHIYDSRLIVLSFMGMGSLLPLALFLVAPYVDIPLVEEFVWPKEVKTYIIILFLAFSATLSQWFLTKAYSVKNISTIAIIGYSIIPFGIFFGLLMGDPFPDTLTLMGIIFIVVAGILAKK